MSKILNSEGPLPENVLTLIKSSKFLHLGTSKDNIPHVSLMNYTFVPSEKVFNSSESSSTSAPLIVVTTHKKTQKYENINSNSNVSVLIHDWISAASNDDEKSSELINNEEDCKSNILKLLQNINQNEISSLSVTLSGSAKILNEDNEERLYYKNLHLNKNPSAKVFIDGDDVAIILIQITASKVADSDNNVASYK
ncbi:hypothetical protein B5S28_g2907 [[Candida] boidinii]|uniref:Unnamed protein product n=1 Tax=Candida boidinii TaxID=5477 RepID=A0ACB5TNZ7_CANBO|nr:hypothetical protein B5S28_g2907 [[Candida] boidinii]OWB62868.1 hypothetical protein B5S29_g3816 [[Candida] boidinii]OWB73046.1 hypothetical protein B5S31_g2778 [[Candida] boidinii]OWB78732.1 hypothetical protein B5S32_g2932 [[Candida] boidinii]GME83070.1 unnamed protein product [[Candida] boidinii]